MIGRPNQRTRYIFWRKVRSSRNRMDLNSLARTRLLETAAATPNLTSRLIRMRRDSIGFRRSTSDLKTVARRLRLLSFVLVDYKLQRLACDVAMEIVGELIVVTMPELFRDAAV